MRSQVTRECNFWVTPGIPKIFGTGAEKSRNRKLFLFPKPKIRIREMNFITGNIQIIEIRSNYRNRNHRTCQQWLDVEDSIKQKLRMQFCRRWHSDFTMLRRFALWNLMVCVARTCKSATTIRWVFDKHRHQFASKVVLVLTTIIDKITLKKNNPKM